MTIEANTISEAVSKAFESGKFRAEQIKEAIRWLDDRELQTHTESVYQHIANMAKAE